MMNIEVRADGARITGYVNVTEKKSRPVITPRGKVIEEIEPRAFAEAINRAGNITVTVDHDKSHIYGIDRVLAVRRGTSRLGGKGQCFTCMICGQKRNLWLEQGKWFVEAYCSVPESRAS